MEEKYGPKDLSGRHPVSDAIFISGKEVSEVGFDDIVQKQSKWTDLRTISLDGLRLDGINSEPYSRQTAFEQIFHAQFVCEELDLGRNLFERWKAVLDICSVLTSLKVLKLNGNRFRDLRSEAENSDDTLELMQALSIANAALEWDTALALCTQRRFPVLQSLSLAFNPLGKPSNPSASVLTRPLTNLDLTSCGIADLCSLAFLTQLPNLQRLTLRSNPIASLSTNPQLVFPRLLFLDLSSTNLATTSAFSPFPQTFPLLISLRTSETPLATCHPDSRLLTIACLQQLERLNYTCIPPNERLDADYSYRQLVTSLLLSVETPEQEQEILSQNPQWPHLCSKYGEPANLQQKRQKAAAQSQQPTTADEEKQYPPNSLGAHMCTFTFYTLSPLHPTTAPQSHTADIPLFIDIYALKGIVGRLFSQPPMSLRLILETDEWDPVPPTKPDENDWSCSEDEDSEEDEEGRERKRVEREERRSKLWVKREEELRDSTRKVGEWVEGKRARVRVEGREL
ncbi:MAG: hypothetical protein Q9170_008027 [Blastenia crenularia]